MSKVKVQGNPSGTGTLTIAAPNTNNDRTLTLPDAAGTLTTSEAVAAAGYTTPAAVLTQFNASGSAPVYACRAWVNFDGTTSPGTIRASGNVSSVTKNSTGNYTVNFTTATPDVNYAVNFTGNNTGFTYSWDQERIVSRATTNVRVEYWGAWTNSVMDVNEGHVSIFR
jgi:hypothetical protein